MRSAIALVRVSTEGQAADDRAGLAAQRRECSRIAEREGLAISEWVELAGVSGAKVLADARFTALLDRLSQPGIAGLIVSDFDRLFRRGRFGDYVILDAFADTGTLLYTSEGRVDPTQDTDALLSLIRGELGAMERRKIRTRTMRAKAEHRWRGRHVAGGPHTLPYGVRFDTGPDRWSYAPAQAEQVRLVFEAVLSGERNFSRLAAGLGIPRTLVTKILSQPLYAGFRVLDASGRVTRGEGIEQVVLEPPLISREAWTRAREIAASRPAVPRGAGPGVYRGFIRCGACGSPMHVHRERFGSATYRCRAGSHGQVIVPAVDLACDAALADRLARPDVVRAALLDAIAQQREAVPDPAESAAERKRLAAERERVTIAYERGLRSLPDAQRRLTEIDGHLARLATDDAREIPAEETADALAALLAEPFAEWAYLEAEQKRRILAVGVEWLRILRIGRAQAAVEMIRLRIPADGPPAAPRDPYRATWAAWGDALEVRVQ